MFTVQCAFHLEIGTCTTGLPALHLHLSRLISVAEAAPFHNPDANDFWRPLLPPPGVKRGQRLRRGRAGGLAGGVRRYYAEEAEAAKNSESDASAADLSRSVGRSVGRSVVRIDHRGKELLSPSSSPLSSLSRLSSSRLQD